MSFPTGFLKEFLSDNIFVAHNATFDYNFINYALQKRFKEGMLNQKLCTCKLARRILPELPSKRLGTVCDHFNINNAQAHRAKGDALATVEVLNNFINILENSKNYRQR